MFWYYLGQFLVSNILIFFFLWRFSLYNIFFLLRFSLNYVKLTSIQQKVNWIGAMIWEGWVKMELRMLGWIRGNSGFLGPIQNMVMDFVCSRLYAGRKHSRANLFFILAVLRKKLVCVSIASRMRNFKKEWMRFKRLAESNFVLKVSFG